MSKYTSPSEVRCPTCEAAPGEGCETFDHRAGVFVPFHHYHLERQHTAAVEGAPIQLTMFITTKGDN